MSTKTFRFHIQMNCYSQIELDRYISETNCPEMLYSIPKSNAISSQSLLRSIHTANKTCMVDIHTETGD